MLVRITTFFQTLITEESTESHDLLTLEIACAVLLCEVMRADGHLSAQEQEKLNQILCRQFSLTTDEVDEIVNKAIELSEHATDFYQFTSKLNQNYGVDERIKIVELLWQVAYADGKLASIEEHIIRKIADLLHLRHNEYIQAKHRVIGS